MANIKPKAIKLLYEEKKGSAGPHNRYIFEPRIGNFLPLNEQNKSLGGIESIWLQLKNWMQEVFLPQGYPESVSSDYLRYQMWDTIQAFFSSIGGALSLQATLLGLGVGESSANPLAATLTWLLKDGTGMVASIAFAYWRGSQLDCNSKQWRIFADVANDAGLLLRFLAPFLPVPFMAVMCLSAVMLALVGVAGGATRAALTLHQARRENMADVSAKDGSQETLVNLGALITSLTILPLITCSKILTCVTFFICIVLHLIANYYAVRSLEMETLNRPRFLHILETWLLTFVVPSIQATNRVEPLLYGPAFNANYFPCDFHLEIGCSLQKALNFHKPPYGDVRPFYNNIMNTFSEEKYILCGDLRRRRLFLVYREGITVDQEMEAFFVAYICVVNFVHFKLNAFIPKTLRAPGLSVATSDGDVIPIVKPFSQRIFPDFLKEINSKGWNTSRLYLSADEWRMTINKVTSD